MKIVNFSTATEIIIVDSAASKSKIKLSFHLNTFCMES